MKAWYILGLALILTALLYFLPERSLEFGPSDPIPSDLVYLVSQLDHTEHVDEVAKDIARYGESAIPYVLGQLRRKYRSPYDMPSCSRFSSVFKFLKSDQAFRLLLVASFTPNGRSALYPVGTLMKERQNSFIRVSPNSINSDIQTICQVLIATAVCGDTLRYPGCTDNWSYRLPDEHMYNWRSLQDIIFYSDSISTGYVFTFPGKTTHIFNKEQRANWARIHGKYPAFYVHEPMILYFHSDNKDRYQFQSELGSDIEAIATLWVDLLFVGEYGVHCLPLGGGGSKSFWVKRSGKWYFLMELTSWIA